MIVGLNAFITHKQNSLILPTVGKVVSPIKGRMGTDSISDFDPEDNNLKEHIKGMLKTPIPQNKICLIVSK
jgi:hypothetical protein